MKLDTDKPIVPQLLILVHEGGQEVYGREAVTQYEHAMQTALLAEQAGASSALITAGLLHDLGYMLTAVGEKPVEWGIDTMHERIAEKYLHRWFGPEVTVPVGLHVMAKRYLCAVDPKYRDTLSPASIESMKVQGGIMSMKEAADFRMMPHAEAAVSLRLWDDLAKVPDLPLPPVEHFRGHIEATLVR